MSQSNNSESNKPFSKSVQENCRKLISANGVKRSIEILEEDLIRMDTGFYNKQMPNELTRKKWVAYMNEELRFLRRFV